MGIDFGMRHIGVALSDELRITANGFETVNWNSIDWNWALDRIAQIVKEKNVTEIVIGKPIRTDGMESETQKKAELFPGLGLADTQRLEYLLLHAGRMDADGAAANLVTV